MSDKRTVATDALETMGTVLTGDGHGRDAIHIAVLPVVAAEDLRPGERVCRMFGGKYATPAPGQRSLGIVDPFLTEAVNAGQVFWLLLYPRTITSLRHVWSHPDFPEEEGGSQGAGAGSREDEAMRAESLEAMAEYAAKVGMSLARLQREMIDYQTTGLWPTGCGPTPPPAMWSHWSVVSGGTPRKK